MGVDSVPLKAVTSNNCDAHAWADDQAVVTVPNRIVVTTSYGVRYPFLLHPSSYHSPPFRDLEYSFAN
jgi:hypothetical protein